MPEKTDKKWIFGRSAIPIASILILTCLLATSWITFDRVGSVINAERWVSHTNAVRASLEKIYGLVVAAESDQRTYLLTLDTAARQRYEGAPRAIGMEVRFLQELVKDNPPQRKAVDDLEADISTRFVYLRSSIDERDKNGLDRTIELLKAGEGFRSMDEIRSEASSMMATEAKLLEERTAASKSETVQAEAAFGFSLLISIVLISAFGYLSNRLILLREDAANEERALRANLEEEVKRTKAAEYRLERTMLELKRSNEELQNFAFVASHDLQEPLRKIRAFSDRVRRRAGDALDDESKDSLDRVESAADRMQRLILDLLDLSRITTKVRPHGLVNLDTAIDEVADDLQARLDETGGKVVHQNLPAVLVDPAQLRQLLQNLIANALKFQRAGVAPIVEIQGERRSDGRVTITVSDNGIGFDPKYADRIFVVFQRLHGRGEYEGSGIGLAIVRKIVERHGGAIEAQGRPGEGASFVFDLPGETSRIPATVRMNTGENQ